MSQSSDTGATGGRVMDNEPRCTWQSSDSEPGEAEFSERGRFGRVQKATTLRQNSDFKSIEAEFRQRGFLAEFRKKFLLFFSSVECSHNLSFSPSLYLYFSNTICTHNMYNVTVDLCMHISKFMQNFVSYL
jgi:hypothetical protein